MRNRTYNINVSGQYDRKRKDAANIRPDIIIVGTGAAGLFCALNLPLDKSILLITKDTAQRSDSFLAQGGISVLKDQNDYNNYFEDTLRAGHYENDKLSVDVMIKSSPEIINDLVSYGVEFEKSNGKFVYTREGAHSTARILFHEDLTGEEITGKLLNEAKKRKNITIMEYTMMIDLICSKNVCYGIIASFSDGTIRAVKSHYVILASGGIGGLYRNSTNYCHMTGDALAIAMNHGIKLQNIDYIQIHPTALYSEKPGRRFLISESVRGEGACLLNGRKQRFVDELLPRDLLTKEIYLQMEREGINHVWLSLRHLGKDFIIRRFPYIYERCLKEGYDITNDYLPVVPAQHYLMGGIKVDINSMTSMDRLYAVGETSCNGVHGANRLASNSLLESLVFAKRAAMHLVKGYSVVNDGKPYVNLFEYLDIEQLQRNYRNIILRDIKEEII